MNPAAKILVVDDSTFMRSILKEILSKAGYTNLLEADNGRQALEIFAKEKPDLLLLDIVMPEVDGLAVLEKIGRQAKIIVVSAVGQEAMVEQAKKSGAAGYVVKPFEEKQVLDEVAKAL